MPMMPPNTEQLALESALSGAPSDAVDAGPAGPEADASGDVGLEQIIADLMQLAQTSQDPKIMALVTQLLQLLGGEDTSQPEMEEPEMME